jgi:hypothetical protein
MKNVTFLFASVLLCNALQVFSQNTSPFWSLAGNSNATSTSKMGTTNFQNLRIVTNNVTRMFLNTNGNIGINTWAPRAPIHVDGRNKDTGIYSIARLYGIVGVDTTPSASIVRVRTWPAVSAGVYGRSNNVGVYGESDAVGVMGLGTRNVTNGIGVLGIAQFGSGVTGVSDGTGVTGSGLFSGVTGESRNIAVRGISPLELTPGDGIGVLGEGYAAGIKGRGVLHAVYATALNFDTSKGVYGSGRYGVYGVGVNTTGGDFPGPGVGLYGVGATGVYGTTTTSFNDAVRADARGAAASWGVYATSTNSYGIFASSDNINSYAAYFSGNTFATGSYLGSDERLKKDIQPLQNGLATINQLRPKFYEFKQEGNYAKMNLPNGVQLGLIAQDVEKVLPHLVKTSDYPIGKIKADEMRNGKTPKTVDEKTATETIEIKAINYLAIIPILIKAMQELNDKVDLLRFENTMIKEELTLLKNMAIKNDGNTFMLQNIPNPVKDKTSIGYVLPALYSKAQLVVADAKGGIVTQIEIAGTGSGNTMLNTANYANGVYTYSLYVDGKKIATKQMIVAK